MTSQAIRKVQSSNEIGIVQQQQSEKKFTRNSKSDSLKSQDDKNSLSNTSVDLEYEKKMEFYGNIYRMKTLNHVFIDSSELIVTGNEQYTTYNMKVETDMGDYHITKRYSEFRTLRKEIQTMYSDVNLKKFPRKKIFGSLKQKTIDSRMKMLNEFLTTALDIYVKKSTWRFLDFIDIQEQFIKRGIHDFFREQAKSALLLKQHPEIINSVPIKPNNAQETKMIEIIQKLNAFSDSVICGFEKLRNFYFKDQPVLNRNFIPLILLGEDKLKGIIELSLHTTKESSDSHLICCQGLKLVLDLMDFQKNPSAQQFIDIYTSTTFQDTKKFNFRAHILNKNAKECKLYALKLLKIYVDAHSKTLSKVTRQLLMDDKTFEEYVKYFKIQNVPRQLLNQVMRDILDEDNNPEHAQANERISLSASNRFSNQHRSQDFKERFMFNRYSVLDKSSNTFAEVRYTMNGQYDNCDLEDLKEAIDDPSIEWKNVYTVEDSFSFRHCDQPDKYILASFFLPLSMHDAQIVLTENRKEWDSLLMENKKVGVNDQNEDLWKESLFFQRYSGTRLLSFIYKRKVIEQNDSIYIFKEPSTNFEYKCLPHEDLGKWYQCIKLSPYKSDRKLKRFTQMNQDSSTTFSLDEEEEEIKSFETLSQNESQHITKIDIIIKCCDNNSVIYTSPFLLNDNRQFVDNIVNLIENTSKQTSGKSTLDQSLNESIASITTPKRSDS